MGANKRSGVDAAPDEDLVKTALPLCGEDEELLMDVIGRLSAHHAADTVGAVAPVVDDFVNQKVGGFRAHWKLGSGGNGDVYLATRIKEPHQRVAIKVLRLREESDHFRRRFLRERQIIALLNHPYIVKLYDADRTRDGTPFFVMEYVQGEHLDRFADANRLTIAQRIELFVKVCGAVQYLHQHLIVHRDLKPANIMVDEDGNPRVLDFGIAKLLRPELMDGEVITVTSQDPMTPRYASPEQRHGGLVTSSSDVYSLGVILFQLLTGNVSALTDRESSVHYAHRLATDHVPAPSNSVADTHATLCREPSKAALRRKLSGDLDAILAKALHPDVVERYATAEAFSDDLRRHLQLLPVRARDNSSVYRAGRFLQRNRIAAAGTIAAFLCLSIGLGVALSQKKRAEAAEATASLEWKRAEAERHTTEIELDRVRELVTQRAGVEQTLRNSLSASTAEYQQFRNTVMQLTADLRAIEIEDERTRGKNRGESSADRPEAFAIRGRSDEVLGRLFALSKDRPKAETAYRSCVANLTLARRAGDASAATAETMTRCISHLH